MLAAWYLKQKQTGKISERQTLYLYFMCPHTCHAYTLNHFCHNKINLNLKKVLKWRKKKLPWTKIAEAKRKMLNALSCESFQPHLFYNIFFHFIFFGRSIFSYSAQRYETLRFTYSQLSGIPMLLKLKSFEEKQQKSQWRIEIVFFFK